MPNIFDYILWRGDLSFAASPFCEVDNLIFSMLSFLNLDGIVPADVLGVPVKLADCYARYREKYPDGEDFGSVIPPATGELFRVAAESVRYRDTYVTAFRAETDTDAVSQFAAVTFVLPDNAIFVAYRGTDDTLVGWREDFNLSFIHPVPAQEKAVAYLTEIASVHRGALRTGGHSKGGNLAVYAAVFAPAAVRDRVVTAYSNDGPGFVEDVILSEEFLEMESRIHTIVPQSSVIGMLLEHKEDYTVIESVVSGGLFQHDPFSWSVLGNRFIHLDGLSRQGQRHDRVLSAWIHSLTPEDRRRLTDALFGMLDATGAKTVSDLTVDTIGKISAAVRSYKELDRETREHMMKLIRSLAEEHFRK